ncbi:MAG: CBS domain-containing protein [Cyclobacteriaceae bacterium]|nr:CBS domain-containing protein [Cyclobacteriaceae bacterium]
MNFKSGTSQKAKQKDYETVEKYMVHVSKLITFSPDQTIAEAIDIILEKRISGAPVLERSGKLVGMLSEKDCLRLIIDKAYHNMPNEHKKVSDYMTTDLRTISYDLDIVTAANRFLTSPVRRFPVVEEDVLIGQISRRDILKAARDIEITTW